MIGVDDEDDQAGAQDDRGDASADETRAPDPKNQHRYKFPELLEFESSGDWPEDAEEDRRRLETMGEQISKRLSRALEFRDLPKITPLELSKIPPDPTVTLAADSREFYRQQQEWQDQLIDSMNEAESHKRKQEQWANWQFWIVAIISFLSLVAAVVSIIVAAN